MKGFGWKTGAALLAGALATTVLAQTGGASGGVNPGGPRSGSPASGSPTSGAIRSETPARAITPEGALTPALPSAARGTTISTGSDRALATPEDRAKCAAFSGIAQADCMADARKQREPRDRM